MRSPSPSRRSLLPKVRYVLRMLTALAATSPTVRNDAIDSISIRVLMRTLSGIASVAERARVRERDIEVVQERRTPAA